MSTTKYEEVMAYLAEFYTDPHDECMTERSWSLQTAGYGQVLTPNRGRQLVHVIALTSVWPKPPGKVCSIKGVWTRELQAAHGPCHNPECYNPRHLSWKTRAENQADRLRDGTDNRGMKHNTAKLTDAQVLEIYDLAWHSSFSYREIASQFGVTPAHVSNLKHGSRWAHLTGHVREECTA